MRFRGFCSGHGQLAFWVQVTHLIAEGQRNHIISPCLLGKINRTSDIAHHLLLCDKFSLCQINLHLTLIHMATNFIKISAQFIDALRSLVQVVQEFVAD
ncbi:uncharacterized protein isoform X3 [Rhodnius prolixus]|uniref:uncharacterized protein isoform X3 n=1 Tax=Rhodnius prolixus TaxID=13249 RepID=UPI003D18D7AE